MDKAQQSLCHLEKIFLTEDLGTSQLFTTKGKVIIYYKSQMHKATCFMKQTITGGWREPLAFT